MNKAFYKSKLIRKITNPIDKFIYEIDKDYKKYTKYADYNH